MSTNGYTNPSGSYTYIGWECNSPFMGNNPPSGTSSTGAMYYNYPYYFYRFALGHDNKGNHGTINQSLDYAARMTFGKDASNKDYTFSTSVLNVGQWRQESAGWFYCRMRVFGNGNMVLP
ncbi:MAG: hypothetical protein LBC12_04145 [Nitrososphaerota archaeon]|nr:hypothetical protein [Nitrososphaerota archaeon]